MGLTGIDPTDPTPHDARELLLNQGPSTSGTSRDVLFYGNKTSAGSATVDTYDDTPINDETDAITRWGRRSELLAMYRAYTMVDQSANIRGIAVTESGGTAASCKLTLSGTSDQSSTITVTITGLDVTLSVAVGDTPAVSGAALVSAINNADDGRLQVSASGAVNGADYDVTVTAAQKGPRGDFIIGNTAKRGVRAKIETTGATNAMTIAKGSVVAGTTADDGTSAIAAAAQAENYYQVAPWHSSNGAGGTATYVAGGAGNITFADANPDTITRTNGDWTAGPNPFLPGMAMTVSGSVSNNGVYLIASVTALVITLDPSESLTAEVLGEGALTASGKFGLGGTTAVSSTDNQIGELVDMIATQASPTNGKEQQAIFGLVGINTQAIAVPTDSDVNTARAKFLWAENSDWTPAMLAAHYAAILRQQQVLHPSANITGYSNSDSTPFKVPAPYFTSDRPTATEIRTSLNNGVSPVGVTAKGRTYIVRDITSKSENSSGNKDYRAREGHVQSAMDFAWQTFKGRWESSKQPFVADNPAQGQPPTKATTTPSFVEGLFRGVVDDLTSSKPLGQYDGPILAPDQADYMKASVTATKIAAGISLVGSFIAVQHLLKFEGKFLGEDEAY